MIAIGSDHGGYELKQEIKRYLEEKNIKVKDIGCFSKESVDYPNIAKEVAKEVQNKECETGILICRSGIGMGIVANKFKGIRCAIVHDEQTAKFAKMHNNANVIAIGADEENMNVNKAICIIRMWIATQYEGGRHDARLKLIEEIEKDNMK